METDKEEKLRQIMNGSCHSIDKCKYCPLDKKCPGLVLPAGDANLNERIRNIARKELDEILQKQIEEFLKEDD